MPASGQPAATAVPGQGTRRQSSPSDVYHKREKAKSSHSFVQPPRRVSAAAQSSFGPTRPGLKSRAHSAPLVPRAHIRIPDDDLDGSDGGGPADDEEIAEDPFFQRYNFPLAEDAGLADKSSSSPDSSSDTEGPMSPTHSKPRPDSLAEPLSSPLSALYPQETHTGPMHEISIAVLGAANVGKTTFIRRALDLRYTPTAFSATGKWTIEGATYLVRLLEIPFHMLDIDDDNRVTWPATIDSMATPRIDGALILYDVTSKESMAELRDTLNAIYKASLSCALVACKCDVHSSRREVDPIAIEQRARAFLEEIRAFQTSETTPETQKRCLSAVLQAIIASKHAHPRLGPPRRRANSSAVRPVSPRHAYLRGHERASSEFSGSRLRTTTGSFESEPKNARFAASTRPQLQPSGTPQESFLDLEESPGYDSADSDAASNSDHEQSVVSDMPSDEKGYTFDQLVDRLLAQPLSKADRKFVAIFLALYRKFACPSQLLDAIVRRFHLVATRFEPQVLKTISQLHHLEILEQWISCYPGDFAHPITRRKLGQFISELQGIRIFAAASRELQADLEVAVEDDDTDWACSDRYREKPDATKTFLSSTTTLEEPSEEDVARDIGGLAIGSDCSQAPLLSPATTCAPSMSMHSTTSSSQTMLNSVEAAQRQSKLLEPTPRGPLSKVQWHLFMGQTDEDIAKELTRIDWIMFYSIRPRDLVRHVSLNPEQKKKCKSLENVNRMIDHFNHLAYWVANFVLLRDKPKHRALMLEKFMRVARELRKLNNYNALGAVLAGINGTAVHRLHATRELITPQTGRDFMKLEILMGTQKSHFAYRLAWENSSGERIPYLPLHRRDLVSAAEGNSTFVGQSRPASTGIPPGVLSRGVGVGGLEAPPGGVTGRERINWRKFEIMGEVIVGVQRAQGMPYPNIGRNDEMQSLLLETRIAKDDDDLYERSVLVEPMAGQGGERKRFNWFKGSGGL